ncbi:MAG: chemotaxis protein CheA [Magnetovibrionaceae bacterium]
MPKTDAKFARLKKTYLADARDHLSRLEAAFDGRGGKETADLPAALAALQGIKGGAGAFGFDALVTLCQQVESLLEVDRREDGDTDLIRQAIAGLKDLLKADPATAEASVGDLLATLSERLNPGGPRRYKILFKPTARLYEANSDPAFLFSSLKNLGELDVEVSERFLPPLEKISPAESYLIWTLWLTTESDEDEIRDVFSMVDDACVVRIEALGPAADSSNGDGSEEAATAPVAVPKGAGDGQPLPAEVLSSDPAAQKAQNRAASVRVELDRIDSLVNVVGELVITQVMMEQHVVSGATLDQTEAAIRDVETMSAHLRDLQEGVMAIRMQPVKTVFSRMPRLVRELARDLGKKVRLVTRGEEAEVDKSVVELLADPLIHMIRNSVDHGIETPEVRRAAGKPEQAEIILAAGQRSGRIVIEVSDDGAGINRERVLAKAVEKGIVAEGTHLSPEEIDDLIFAPGFSTASEVTDVSGRGVGMDVVRRSIQDLGGRVTVFSSPGEGARFLLILPLTLAVMDGMIIRVGTETYVLPLACIVESVPLADAKVQTVMEKGRFARHRGRYVPLISLADLFGVESLGASDKQADEDGEGARGLVVLVETGFNRTIGLLVDELLGQRQVVVKSLEENLVRIDGISSATILGDGRVGLILDVDGLEAMVGPKLGVSAQLMSSAPPVEGIAITEGAPG